MDPTTIAREAKMWIEDCVVTAPLRNVPGAVVPVLLVGAGKLILRNPITPCAKRDPEFPVG